VEQLVVFPALNNFDRKEVLPVICNYFNKNQKVIVNKKVIKRRSFFIWKIYFELLEFFHLF